MYRFTITLPDEAGKYVKAKKRGQRIQYVTRLILEDIKRGAKQKAFEEFAAMEPLTMNGNPTQVLRAMREDKTKEIWEKYGTR